MGFVVKAVKKVVKTVGKVIGGIAKVAGGIFGFSIGGKGKKAEAVNNLNKSLEPEAYRKIVFGKIAAPLDVRYWEVWGTNGQFFDEVIALACHRINSVGELYFEDKLGFAASATTASGTFAGTVTRAIKTGINNQTGMAVGGGSQWTTAATFDGCSYIKLSWVPDEKKLPNGIPDRYTQVVEGAFVYDPRRDSTVPGGSGTHRANDRTTWAYATLDGNGVPIGRNNALQALWYLLGWTVPTKNGAGTVTGEMLVAGRGVDPQDINMATFIAAANACEVAGYYTDLLLSTEDSHTSNEDKITCDGLIGRLIDPGGLWSYYANVDDTASIAVDLTDDDVLQGTSLTWNEFKGMSDQFNQVRGKFVYPASPVLYQAFPYPMVRDATYETNLGVKRSKPLDFQQVLDSTLAQRLARLMLNEGQYQGELSANWNYKALRAQAWSVVRYTSTRFGFTKIFRVWRHDLSIDGGVNMLLKEIHSSIWSAGTVTPPAAPGLGLAYQATQEISATGVTKTLMTFDAPDGTKGDGFLVAWAAPPNAVRRTEIRYRLVGASSWTTEGPVERDVTSILIGPVYSGALYEVQVRHITINEIAGPWIATAGGNFFTGTYGNVNAAAIIAAGGTAIWSSITGTGKPSDNAGTSNLLTPIGSFQQVRGNTTWKAGGTHGSQQGGAVGVAQQGACFISSSTYTMRGGSWFHYLALGSDGTAFTLVNNLYAVRMVAASVGTLDFTLYRNGSVIMTKNTVPATQDTRVALVYDGQRVTVLIDGGDFGMSLEAQSGLTLYPKVLDIYQGYGIDVNSIKDIVYGPYSNNTASGTKLYDYNGGRYSIVGNAVTCLDPAAGWTTNVYSRESLYGNAMVTAQLLPGASMLGLWSGGTPGGTYAAFDYAVYRAANNNYYTYSHGANVGTLGTAFNGVTFTDATVWAVAYDGIFWRLFADGVLMQKWAGPATVVSVGVGIASIGVGSKVTNVNLGAYTSNVWADIDGDGRPEQYATTGENLIYNGNAERGDTGGWITDVASGTAGTAIFATSTGQASNGKWGFYCQKATGGTDHRVSGRAIPVKGGRKYLVKVNLNGNVGTAAGRYIRMCEKSSPPLDGVFVRTSEMTTNVDLAINAAWPGSATSYEYEYVATAGAMFASPQLINYTTGPTAFRWDDFSMTEVLEWSNVGDDGFKPEDGADVTVLVQIPIAIKDIAASTDGTVKAGELPVDLAFKLIRGASTDITTSATWTRTVISGSITCTMGAATGYLNVTALGSTAVVQVTATYGAIVRSERITVNLLADLPETGGGGTGGTSATGSTGTGANSDTYGSWFSSTLTVKPGTGGTVTLTTPNFKVTRGTSSPGTSTIYGKWQWRVPAGAWADVSTETQSSAASTVNEPPIVQNKGTLNANKSKTGLTAGTDYEFRLLTRVASGTWGTTQHYFSGAVSAVGS